jgi:hypothetical protein
MEVKTELANTANVIGNYWHNGNDPEVLNFLNSPEFLARRNMRTSCWPCWT